MDTTPKNPGSTVAIAAIITALFIAIAGGVMWWKYKASVIPWKSLPSPCSAQMYVAPADVDPNIICADLIIAHLLLAKTTLPADAREKSYADVRVFVVNGEKWTDNYGRTVGGESNGSDLYVVKDLSPLLHELAHAAEFAESRNPDSEHKTWQQRGIWNADESYRSILKHQGADAGN